MSPRFPCSETGCGQYATYRGRCALHSKERDRQIDRTGRATYSTKRWHVLRRRKLSMNPICQRCNKELATDVHHRHGVEVDPWSLEGLEALCHPCHSRETRKNQMRAT